MMSHPLAVQGAAAPFLAPDGASDSRSLRERFAESYARVVRFLQDPLSSAIDDMIREAFPLETRSAASAAMKRFRAREYLREASKRHPEWNVRRAAP
jgi:hypothetical protein